MKLSNFIKSVFVGVPIGVTLLDLVGYVARVDGISMQPALNPDRSIADYVFLNRWAVRSHEIKRGEIISLVSPKDPDQKIIKRVVGIQGDIVATLGYKRDVVQVPEGHCWVEGDHTGHSMDSNNFGPVSVANLIATMRGISLVDRLEFDFTGNVLRNGLILGDLDNDGNHELIVGGENGEVAIFKGKEKWLTLSGLNFVSCIAIGDILNVNKNCLVIITGDGWCHIYCVDQTSSDSPEAQTDEKTDEGIDQVDGAIFSSESMESEKSISSESSTNVSMAKEKHILKRLHLQRIPANSKDILLGDIDGDGLVEMVLGLTDRVVRSYRWCNNSDVVQFENQTADSDQSQVTFENISGQLVGLNKWECAKQIGSVTLHHLIDGTPSLLVAQPGGTFMRIICQNDEVFTQSIEAAGDQSDSGSSQSENLLGSKIDYQFLGLSRMRNQNISTEILGNLKTKPSAEQESAESDASEVVSNSSSHSCQSVRNLQKIIKTNARGNPYVVATLDGTIMLIQNEIILWAIAVDHQIFALEKLDVTGNGIDDIVACCWDGYTYILDQDKNCVRFQLDESVQAFACGYYNVTPDSPPVTCFVYVTFRNQIYIYYDIPLKVMVCKRFEPDLTAIKHLLVNQDEQLDKKAKRQLVEYLLYGVQS